MADSLQQELGFTAEQAIEQLAKLEKAMASVDKQFAKSADSMKAFNTKGGATLKLLKELATRADKAGQKLARVAGLQNAVTGAGAAKAPTTAAAAPNVDAYIKQLESMYQVSDKATKQQKRAFQSAITSAAEFAAKNKVSMGQVADQSRHLDKNFTGTANKMANNLSKVESASKRHLDAAGQSVRRFTVDWQTMARVVATQAIVRALSAIRNGIRTAIGNAVEFQKAIAEIGTIAPTQDLGLLSDHVREISDAFNVPLETTAKGYYQAISNQVGSTVEDFDKFSAAAARFSKTAVTEVDDSVNLLSGTMNAFGKDVSQVEDIAAKFFITIKQGRLVGSELAKQYGTVATTASELGISMEELNAAMATVTIRGISLDKATTQLRGVMTSFLKPTEAMTEAIHKLGFESGSQLLQAYNLQEALQAVASTTDGSEVAMAKLIPRVRGLTGGLILVRDESNHFNETLDAQAEKLQEVYGRGYDLVMNTDAEKVTKELNRLQNYFTTEFGDVVLQASGKLLVAVGGAEQLERILNSMASSLPTLVPVLGGIAVGMGAIALQSKLAATGVSALTTKLGLLVAGAAAYTLGDYIGSQFVDSWDREFKDFQKQMKSQEEARIHKIDQEVSAERRKVDELERLLARDLANTRQKYFAEVDAAKQKNREIVDDVKFFTGEVIREQQRQVQAYQNEVQNLAKNVLNSEKSVYKLRIGLEDKLFASQTKRLTDEQKVFANLKRAAELAGDASTALSRARTTDQRASADEEFRRAQAFVQQALGIAEGTDNRTLEARALQSLEQLTQQNIAAEKDYQRQLTLSKEANLQRARSEEKRLAALRVKQKQLIDSFTLYDEKTGKLLSSDERQQKLATMQKRLQEFIRLSTQGRPLDVGSMLNFTNVGLQMTAELNKYRIDQVELRSEEVQRIHDQMQTAFNRFSIGTVSADMLKRETGIEISGADDASAAVEKFTEKLNQLITTQGEYRKVQARVDSEAKIFSAALKEVRDSSSGFSTGLAGGVAVLNDLLGRAKEAEHLTKLGEAMKFLDQASKGGSFSIEQLDEMINQLSDNESKQDQFFGTLLGGFKTDIANALQQLRTLVIERQNLQDVSDQSLVPVEQLDAEIQRLESLKERFEKPKTDAQAMAGATSAAQVAASNSVHPLQTMAQYWSQMAMDAKTVATASMNASFNAAYSSRGGPLRYLASGGQARGTDKIPAMLTKGEYVWDAGTTQRWFTQLQAMGAGQQPVYRESGGQVTTIGDVSINVTESKTPELTARKVWQQIERQARRGAIRRR